VVVQPIGTPGGTPVTRVLVVANQTLGGDGFYQAVRARAAAAPASFFVLVPATPPEDFFDTAVSAYGGTLPVQEDLAEAAAVRLERVLAELRSEGIAAEGAIGDPDPVVAIEEAMDRRRYDEVILSTLQPGVSRWLRLDVVRRVEEACGVPVTHVAGSPGLRSGEAAPPA
jgi:GABA permease